MRRVSALLVGCVLAVIVAISTRADIATLFSWGATLPSSCAEPALFFDTDATTGRRLYGCESGAFVLQGNGDVLDVGDCDGPACFTAAGDGTLLRTITDFIVELDDDNNGTESFQVKDGAGAIAFELTEAGATTQLSSATIGTVTDPADTGVVNLDNADKICWEASAAGTDVCMAADASEIIQMTGGTIDGADLTDASVTAADVASSLDTRVALQAVIVDPDPAAVNYLFYLPPWTGTITRIDCEVVGGTSLTVELCDGEDYADDTCATSIGGNTHVCDATGVNDTSLSATGFVARDKVSLVISAESGSVDRVIFYVTATVD